MPHLSSGPSKAKKKRAARVPRQKKPSVWGRVALFVFGVPIVVVSAFFAAFNVNAYRGAIEEAISRRLHRPVVVSGPILWRATWKNGLEISASDIVVANPPGASRPDMARIGRMDLHVDLRQLSRHKLAVTALDLVKTEAQFEVGADNKGNWAFDRTPEEKEGRDIRPGKAVLLLPEPFASFSLETLHLSNSRLGFRAKDGSLSLLDVPDLRYEETDGGVRLQFSGTGDGLPIKVIVTGGALDDLMQKDWPFSLRALYAGMEIGAKGTLSADLQRATLASFVLRAGESRLAGQLALSFGGKRPAVKGSLRGAFFNSADLESPNERPANQGVVGNFVNDVSTKVSAPFKAVQTEKLFSRHPFALDGLRAADLDLDISIDKLVFARTVFRDVEAKLLLNGGKLVLSPVLAAVADSRAEARIAFDASRTDAALIAKIEGKGLEFSKLFDLSGAEALISGKGDLLAEIKTYGRSSRDMAAHADGKIDLLMDSGALSSGGLSAWGGSLLGLFVPGAGALTNPGVHCMAARIGIENGLAAFDGFLVDTDVTTVAGAGTVNLPDERLNIYLRTRPKGIGIGAAVPPMHIHGDLLSPSFDFDGGAAWEKVKSLLTQGAILDSGVPEMLTLPGRNACALTLDHQRNAVPAAPRKEAIQTPATGNDVQVRNLTNALKDVGSQILHSLGGNR